MFVSHSDQELRSILHAQKNRADTTVNSIVNVLKLIREQRIDLNDPDNLFDFVSDKSLATQRQYSMNAMTYLLACAPTHPSIKAFKQEMDSCNAQLQSRYDLDSFTDNQQKNKVEWSELMDKKRELETKVDAILGVKSSKYKQYRQHTQDIYAHLLLCMYTEIPPQRAEFCDVRIVTNDTKVGNVYVKGSLGDDKIILRNYKTAKTYGKKEIPIPPALSQTVRRSLRLLPRDFLFADMNNSGPTSRSVLKERMARIFPGRRLGCNIVRKVTKTEFSRRGEPGASDLAKGMGHSLATAERCYNNHKVKTGPNSMGLHL